MDICVRLFCVCVVLCVGSGLATGWSPAQGALPTVYMIKKLQKAAKDQQKEVIPMDGWMDFGNWLNWNLFFPCPFLDFVMLSVAKLHSIEWYDGR
jgi:hypothetical protein